MELTHGHHFMARRLAVTDGPDGICNALAYYMPLKIRDKIGDLIARCHDEQFMHMDNTQEHISKAGYVWISRIC
jgi:tRNA A-37 threonylcarbamoyl transferase component Bud32